jgi:hypothetical protein
LKQAYNYWQDQPDSVILVSLSPPTHEQREVAQAQNRQGRRNFPPFDLRFWSGARTTVPTTHQRNTQRQRIAPLPLRLRWLSSFTNPSMNPFPQRIGTGSAPQVPSYSVGWVATHTHPRKNSKRPQTSRPVPVSNTAFHWLPLREAKEHMRPAQKKGSTCFQWFNSPVDKRRTT